MTNLQNLIDEITSLEIKISKFEKIYILDYYNQSEPEHENRLRQLNGRALTDIINLTDEQIKRQIKRLEAEHNKLKKLKVYFNDQLNFYFQGTVFDANEFIFFLERYLIVSFPDGKLNNNVITKEFMYCLSDAIMFKAAYLIGFINSVKEQTLASEPQYTATQPETPADKIRTILEPLKGAFADNTHIDKIIEGFVLYKVSGKLPSSNKAVLDILPIDFIKPFRFIQDMNILKQWEIRDLLLYFIEKSTPDNREYSPAYIQKLLGNSKAKI